MSLRHMLEVIAGAVKRPDWYMKKRPVLDTRPVEAALNFQRPVSSLEDLRRMMAQISKEQEDLGNESFEEFYDFGDDEAFEDIPAPAQMKHEAVLLARDRDFEGEVLKAKEEYKKRLEGEARKTLLEELRKKGVVQAKEEEE